MLIVWVGRKEPWLYLILKLFFVLTCLNHKVFWRQDIYFVVICNILIHFIKTMGVSLTFAKHKHTWLTLSHSSVGYVIIICKTWGEIHDWLETIAVSERCGGKSPIHTNMVKISCSCFMHELRIQGHDNDLTGKNICYQEWQPKFDPWNSHCGRRERFAQVILWPPQAHYGSCICQQYTWINLNRLKNSL